MGDKQEDIEAKVDAMFEQITRDMEAIDETEDWKSPPMPLARVKKIIRSEECIITELEKKRCEELERRQRESGNYNESNQPPIINQHPNKFMIAGESPVLIGKACELMAKELALRSWRHAERNKRKTLQRHDVIAAVGESEVFDFLIDIVPRMIPGNFVGPGAGAAPTPAPAPPAPEPVPAAVPEPVPEPIPPAAPAPAAPPQIEGVRDPGMNDVAAGASLPLDTQDPAAVAMAAAAAQLVATNQANLESEEADDFQQQQQMPVAMTVAQANEHLQRLQQQQQLYLSMQENALTGAAASDLAAAYGGNTNNGAVGNFPLGSISIPQQQQGQDLPPQQQQDNTGDIGN